jgi:hypothetical protein
MTITGDTGIIVAIGAARGPVFAVFLEEAGDELGIRDQVQRYNPYKVRISSIVDASREEFSALRDSWAAGGLQLRPGENWFSPKALSDLRRIEAKQSGETRKTKARGKAKTKKAPATRRK